MARLLMFVLLALQVCTLHAEQILRLGSGERYLGRETADNSGIFVDCQKKQHKVADGVILPTTQSCERSNVPNPSQASLITLSPMEVVAVNPANKTIVVEADDKKQTLDMQSFPNFDFGQFSIGKTIGIVTDKNSRFAKWISPDAIFDSDFALEAKAAHDPDKPDPDKDM